MKKVSCKITDFFRLGVCTSSGGEPFLSPSICTKSGATLLPRIGRYVAVHRRQEERDLTIIDVSFPSQKFIRVVERVRAVNQKLVAYERGFISEGGIKDREWYKHLVVAPGEFRFFV